MDAFSRDLSRRSFLTLSALFPLTVYSSAFQSEEHHFQYEGVIGTSLDLVIWTPHAKDAEQACRAALGEIDRLALILDTRRPASEISLLGEGHGSCPSSELTEVLAAYDHWERRTGGIFSIHPRGASTSRNVDALGKAYIIDRAAKVARESASAIDAVLLNIGGDISVWGRSFEIAVADPDAWHDNAEPITRIRVRNAAVATSGSYARGAHLFDARRGEPLTTRTAATVVASDAVTANALATTLCLTEADQGLRLVESTPGAEALRMAPHGIVQCTPGFARLERAAPVRPAPSDWPPGYQLDVSLTLTAGHSSKRPYVAVWVERSSGELVRILAYWGNKSKYLPRLQSFWALVANNQDQLRSVTRATRPPGHYELSWDGLDEQHKPAPPGSYRIVVETDQENGTYARQTGSIDIGDSPASTTLPATSNFEAVAVHYGPRQDRP